VKIYIHYVDLRFEVNFENRTYVENDEVKVSITIRNRGDADSDPVSLTLLLDGKLILEKEFLRLVR